MRSLQDAWPAKRLRPGLTPEPHASKSILDNIRDVAKLDAKNMNNNIAFNVKVVPAANETHQKVVDNIYSYVKTYSDLGGMQMQLNVVSSKTLRDAMEHPENYQNLLVRISGYNAYFVTLNRDMQMELIERAEFGIIQPKYDTKRNQETFNSGNQRQQPRRRTGHTVRGFL